MKTLHTLFLASLYCLATAFCLQARAQQASSFRLPDVPAVLATPEERAAYLSCHYWDHFDFSDVFLIDRPEVTEQAFVDFIGILPYTDRADTALETLLHRASVGKKMLRHFILLGDKYLYEPNSPMHNEELYILMLRALLANPALDETEKIRPRHRLETALKNRPGHTAADFGFVCRDGRRMQLNAVCAPYLILYFNDPDCDDCRRAKERLVTSQSLNRLMDSGSLALLSVCVGGKTAAWQQAAFPARWIDGYDEGRQLTRRQVYDLKAMPTLYLLDSRKRVILKDISIDKIEECLRHSVR